jgi:hypothetical protein
MVSFGSPSSQQFPLSGEELRTISKETQTVTNMDNSDLVSELGVVYSPSYNAYLNLGSTSTSAFDQQKQATSWNNNNNNNDNNNNNNNNNNKGQNDIATNMPDLSNIASIQHQHQQQQYLQHQQQQQLQQQQLQQQQQQQQQLQLQHQQQQQLSLQQQPQLLTHTQYAQLPNDVYITILQQQQQQKHQQQQLLRQQQQFLQQFSQMSSSTTTTNVSRQTDVSQQTDVPPKKKRGRPPGSKKTAGKGASEDPSLPPSKKPKGPTAKQLGTQFNACVTQYQNDVNLWTAQREALEHKCSESELRYKEMDRINREAIETLKGQMRVMERDRDIESRFKEMERISKGTIEELKLRVEELRKDHAVQISTREKMHGDLVQQNLTLVQQKERESIKYENAMKDNARDKKKMFELERENVDLTREFDDYKKETSETITKFRRRIKTLQRRVDEQRERVTQRLAEEPIYNDEDLPICTHCFGCQSSEGWSETCRRCSECWHSTLDKHVSPFDGSLHVKFEDYRHHYFSGLRR